MQSPVSNPADTEPDDDEIVVSSAFTPKASVDEEELVLEARTGWISIDWRELWRHRELLGFMVWRDVKVRYKQAVLGFAWAVLAPLMSVVVMTLLFGEAAGFKKFIPPEIPYAMYVFAGLIGWQMIAAAISQGGLSLVNQQNLLSKIYMPRLFIPASVIGSAAFDMLIALVVFGAMMIWYQVPPTWTIVFLPLLIGLTMLAGLAVAFTLSALTVSYRDIRFVIPFATQLLMLVSAVGFPPEAFANRRWVIAWNPIAGLIGGFRAALFRDVPWHPGHLAYSVGVIVALLAFGLFYFRKTERRFADIA